MRLKRLGITRDKGERDVSIRGLNSPLTRRAFLVLAGQGAIFVGLGAAIRLFGQRYKFLRPPGALTESEFLSRCVKCQKCQQVCPTRVIVPALVTEDVASFGTPKLGFRLGYCDLCLDCIRVCPTGALAPTAKEAVRLGVAEVDKERCVAWSWKGCTRCHDECPFDAIVLDSNQRPIVDAGKCNGCGLCEYICPSSSLRAYTHTSGKGIVVVPL